MDKTTRALLAPVAAVAALAGLWLVPGASAQIDGRIIRPNTIEANRATNPAAWRAYLTLVPGVNFPTVTGGGATGTWPISVSGAAANAVWAKRMESEGATLSSEDGSYWESSVPLAAPSFLGSLIGNAQTATEAAGLKSGADSMSASNGVWTTESDFEANVITALGGFLGNVTGTASGNLTPSSPLDATKLTGYVPPARIAAGVLTAGYVPIVQANGTLAYGPQTGEAGTGGAPLDALYVLGTANGALPGALSLGALGNGLLVNTVTDGVGALSIATASDLPSHTHDYVPRDGTGASGTWPIGVTGNAATATTASSVANALTIGNGLTATPSGTYDGSVARSISVNGYNVATIPVGAQEYGGPTAAIGILAAPVGNPGIVLQGGSSQGYMALNGTAIDFSLPITVNGDAVSLFDHEHATAYQPLDADLTAIAGLAPLVNGKVLKVVDGAWAQADDLSGEGGGGVWGSITGTLGDQTDLSAALGLKADASALSSHTGSASNPHAVTAAQTGAYTTAQADAALGLKADVASPVFTGVATAPTFKATTGAAAGRVPVSDADGDLVLTDQFYNIALAIDGAGSTVLSGNRPALEVVGAGAIVRATLIADRPETGPLSVTLYKTSLANYASAGNQDPTDPGASGWTTVGTLTLSGAVAVQDTTLSGWVTQLAADDILVFSVLDDAADAERLTVSLKVKK